MEKGIVHFNIVQRSTVAVPAKETVVYCKKCRFLIKHRSGQRAFVIIGQQRKEKDMEMTLDSTNENLDIDETTKNEQQKSFFDWIFFQVDDNFLNGLIAFPTFSSRIFSQKI